MKGISLPYELTTEILLWLPVESLLRFKSVSKKWQSLIVSRQFVTTHHERSKEHLLVHHEHNQGKDHTFSLLCRETQSVVIPRLDLSYWNVEKLNLLLSPCNGVFFMLHHGSKMVLWNPATRKLKTLPQPDCNIEVPRHVRRPVSYTCRYLHYGFDDKTHDYKVLIIHVVYADNDKTYPCMLFGECYTLNRDSWEEVDIGSRSDRLKAVTMTDVCLKNGMFVLLAEGADDAELMIMSFDFSDETTTTTLLPDGYNKLSTEDDDHIRSRCMYNDAMNLFVLDDRVALVNHLRDASQQDCYEIWVLNEIGNAESWTKLYKFGPCSDLNLPLGDLKQHELFTQSEGSGELIWGYPLDPTVKHLHYTEEDSKLEVYSQAFEYKESLASLD